MNYNSNKIMEIKDTYCVYKTLREMLQDRGYKITNIFSFEEFNVMYEENNYDIIDDENKIYAMFYKDSKTFGKKDLETIVSKIHAEYGENINIIIILKDKYNVIIEKELSNEYYQNVEIFLFKNLTFNITKHVDMPKFYPMTEEEIKEITDKYKTKKTQFPRMLLTDPIARYYGVKSGGMFRIVRKSPASGNYITYRMVR